MIWKYLLKPVLGPLSGPVERQSLGRSAIRQANEAFEEVRELIRQCNDKLLEYTPPGLRDAAGVTLTPWSRHADHIASSLTFKSLRKLERTIPLRVDFGSDEVKIGEVPVPLANREKILNVISRAVFDFFST